MSGFGFASKGGPGPATQTVWFGAVIDRLNMLLPYSTPTGLFQTSNAPAHFGNQWNPFHASFGAFTTAPDGTTSVAKLLVEDNTTNIHYIQAGVCVGFNSYRAATIPLRCAAFLKAGTRTRVGFLIADLQNLGSTSPTLTVVFDLLGGQVGVAATKGGGSGNFGRGRQLPLGTQMIPYPNGWWLCIQDTFYENLFDTGNLGMEIFLDSGSGTGALSNNYAGNGTSGAYIWRTNMMPIAAWGMNTQTFLDDFNSISTIDINNTKNPGFNWYLDCNWPSGTGQTGVTSPSQVSVSNSVVTLTGPCPSSGGFMMQNVANTNPSISNAPVVGNVIGGGNGRSQATLYDVKMSWDYLSHATPNQLWWAPSQQSIQQSSDPRNLSGGREFDFMQAGEGVIYANTDCLVYAYGHPGGGVGLFASGQAAFGFPQWSPNYAYTFGPTQIVYYVPNGLVYKTTTNNTNAPPPSNPGIWTQVTYPATISQPAFLVDYTVMHVYSNLVIPYWNNPGISGPMLQQTLGSNTLPVIPDKAMGLKLTFFDGACCDISGWWGPNIGPAPDSLAPEAGSFLFNSDWQDLIHSLSSSGFAGELLFVDYFKVTQ